MPILVYLPIVLAVPPDVIEVGGTAHTSHLFSLRPLRFSSLVHPWIGLYICCPQIFHDSFSQGLTLFPSCSERCIQSCLTLCDPWTVPPPGSSVHGILQARILEWVASPFSRGSSRPRDQTQSPALQTDSLPAEPPGKLWNWWSMEQEASGISKSPPREGRMRYELDWSHPQQPYDLGWCFSHFANEADWGTEHVLTSPRSHS